MTEAEWLTSDDIGRMQRFITGRASRRKVDLWHYAGFRQIVLQMRGHELNARPADLNPQHAALEEMRGTLEAARDLLRLFCLTGQRVPEEEVFRLKEALPRLVRCVFGNPFRRVRLDRGCLTPTVRALARVAYDEPVMPACELDTARLAVLADACEEAGMPAGLLAHLRQPGPHMRGCHVVDAILDLS